MELKSILKDNKRGQIQSLIFVIASIFAIGIVIFFLNHLFDGVYTELDDYLNDSKYEGTEAQETLQTSQNSLNSSWDYVFLGITIGYIILLALTAFSTRIHPAFYFIYVIISLFGLLIAVMLSNTWHSLSQNPAFSETITRFTITNALLGSYYPTFILLALVVFLVILFGKPPGGSR